MMLICEFHYHINDKSHMLTFYIMPITGDVQYWDIRNRLPRYSADKGW